MNSETQLKISADTSGFTQLTSIKDGLTLGGLMPLRQVISTVWDLFCAHQRETVSTTNTVCKPLLELQLST